MKTKFIIITKKQKKRKSQFIAFLITFFNFILNFIIFLLFNSDFILKFKFIPNFKCNQNFLQFIELKYYQYYFNYNNLNFILIFFTLKLVIFIVVINFFVINLTIIVICFKFIKKFIYQILLTFFLILYQIIN